MRRDGLPDILDVIKDRDAHLGRTSWPGLWRGRVEDVDDPERRGRIRVRVYNVHTEDVNNVPVNRLPWAEPCFQDAGQNYGEFYMPYKVGDMLWVMFEGGDPDYPVWMGGWYGERELPEELTAVKEPTGYPHRQMVFKSRRGHKLEVSDEFGDLEVKLTDAKGNFIWLDTEEDLLRIWWQGNKEEIITGDYTLCVDGSMTTVIGKDRNSTVHRNDKLVVDGTAGGGHRHVSIKATETETVGSSAKKKVGGNENVQVGGSMYHLTGGKIYHNSGGGTSIPRAKADKRLPNPRYTIQERKPAFPNRIDDYRPLHEKHYPYKIT